MDSAERKAARRIGVREARIAAGLCAYCGLRPPTKENQNCELCSEKLRPIKRKAGKHYREQAKRDAVQAYGNGTCACCGETECAFLTLDHVDSDGAHHRRNGAPTGWGFYRWLRDRGYPQVPRLQVLCHNCNSGRYHNGGICPHKQKAAA